MPEFKSARELVRFLDDPGVDLSILDLATLGEPADVEIDKDALRLQAEAEYRRHKKLRPVTMRLDHDLVLALKRIAARRGISYQTLARMWLRERAIYELRQRKARNASEAQTAAWPQRVGEQTRAEQLLVEMKEHLSEIRAILRKRSK
jgi:hypothetical protein